MEKGRGKISRLRNRQGDFFLIYWCETKQRRNTMKRRIAVLFGGCSDEYTISLQSAQGIIGAIDQEKYELVLIGISKEGRWYRYEGPIEAIGADRWQAEGRCTPAILSPDRGCHGLMTAEGERLHIDAALPVLHGKNGEDGTVQGLLALSGIPLIGCGCLSSALCMDKYRAHQVAEAAGVAAPRDVELAEIPSEAEVRSLAEELGYPLFVKPVNGGSSCGISRVTAPEELMPAVLEAFRHDSKALLEEAVDGVEVGCAVIGRGRDLTIGVVDEIEIPSGFFDYTEKYTQLHSAIHTPGRMSVEKAKEIQRTAATLYRALDCAGFARVDMFLTRDGQILFNEINTIPGFTSHSRFPKMLMATGLSFPEIVEKILQQGLEQ